MLLSADAENASRTESVPAITTDSGPAAARRPFFEAIERSDAVGGGSESAGHADGNRRNFASPAIAWKPRACEVKVSVQTQHSMQRILPQSVSLLAQGQSEFERCLLPPYCLRMGKGSSRTPFSPFQILVRRCVLLDPGAVYCSYVSGEFEML